MKTIIKLQMLLVITVSATVQAQEAVNVPLSQKVWDINAKDSRFEEYKGKKALYLENGKARLKDASFKNGTIEYDIAFEQKRNFAGVHFRIQDDKNYEEYYLRPHQSGNPDAMQYTPVINGNAGWQLYHGEGHWSAFPFKFEEWMHVKLVVLGNKMQVYIDNMEKPILNVADLKMGEVSGGLGFGTFLGAAHYANLTYRNSNDVVFVKSESEEEKTTIPPGLITSYEVSEGFPSKDLDRITDLKDLEVQTAKKMETEPSGLLNLSKISPVSEDTNTVLAKFSITSDSGNEMKRLEFGYSDSVKVFVNGKLVYGGDNGFRSRDYRYLGSIGFFDSIFLDLQEGHNELVFAVTERMGGWGIMTKLSSQ